MISKLFAFLTEIEDLLWWSVHSICLYAYCLVLKLQP